MSQRTIQHDDYNNPCSGRWSVDEVTSRYADLAKTLGGSKEFYFEPEIYTKNNKFWSSCNVVVSIAGGVRIHDRACIELAVQFIEDNIIGLRTGYIRERLARSLRHVCLSIEQKERLAKTFVSLLEQSEVKQEYREYVKLFKVIGVEPYTHTIQKYLTAENEYIRKIAKNLLDISKAQAALTDSMKFSNEK